jgi:hypothetical protein
MGEREREREMGESGEDERVMGERVNGEGRVKEVIEKRELWERRELYERVMGEGRVI